jgi:hypothetical protein
LDDISEPLPGFCGFGTLVQDAWFAVLAIESGCECIIADRLAPDSKVCAEALHFSDPSAAGT